MQSFFSIQDLATRYGCSKATIHLWMRKGLLPESLKIGGKRLWRISEVEAYERRLQA
jgi:predicted DNA-binding transcriptional regulator AlpA